MSKNNEWYTPSVYTEAAREVMGGIDLDPASKEEANQIVKATTFYTEEQNGLLQPWYGRIFLNPPFYGYRWWCHPQPDWIKRLFWEYEHGHVEQAILLCMAAVKQHWFHTLWDYTVCLNEDRIHFHRPGKKPEELRESTCFVYLGPHTEKFVEVFSKFGTVARRVSPPRPKPVTLELWEREAAS
jgi:hypothetical protein